MRCNGGMTLVEVLISCAVLAVVLMIFVSGMTYTIELTAKAEQRNKMGQELESYLLKLEQYYNGGITDIELDETRYYNQGFDDLSTYSFTEAEITLSGTTYIVTGYTYTVADTYNPNATLYIFSPEVFPE